MKKFGFGLLFLGFAASAPSTASADCQCRAGGQEYELGQIACLRLPEGNRLARCSMVLNNSSWTKLGDACPTTFDDDQNAAPLSLAQSGPAMSVANALPDNSSQPAALILKK